ncbi:MAG: glycogen debranching N-terminal domain-containing protein [Acidobacteriota bacterium]|nr:glycogen debranching N-terminal domain-containing protein [Acidobacteriota bacterium]
MNGIQPLLHDLVCSVTAPMQVWSSDCGQVENKGAQGIYIADQRVVSKMVLESSTHALQVIGSEVLDHGTSRFISTVRNPSMAVDPEVQLTRIREVGNDSVTERLELTNASNRAETVQLRLVLTPNNSTMEEVKQGLENNSKVVVETADQAGSVSWKGTRAQTTLTTDGAVSTSGDDVLVDWAVQVPAGETKSVQVKISPSTNSVVLAPPYRELKDRGAEMLAKSDKDSDLHVFLSRSLSDLDGLTLSHENNPELRFIGAGAPWFLTLFGRDSLITAGFLNSVDTSLVMETLALLASLQGQEVRVETAEQPGKILHEVRSEPLRLQTSSGPLNLPPVYYGTIDATPLWISTLHDAWKAGADEEDVRALLPNLRLALKWMRDFGDADRDGFLEYLDEAGTGLANQGWKDSGDSVRWHDGSLADGPIALCEVQGYAHRAALDGAEMLEFFGEDGEPWRAWAADLKIRFRDQFWVEKDGFRYPAIALDAAKRPVDSLTSNIGHLLGSGLLDGDEVDDVMRALMSPEMFSGYGIHTASTTNDGFWPYRYHVGSVWPHDTAMIIRGMWREGRKAEAKEVARGLMEAARRFDWRLPELFAGVKRDPITKPLPYPASCRPQAWAAASAVVVAEVLTGN